MPVRILQQVLETTILGTGQLCFCEYRYLFNHSTHVQRRRDASLLRIYRMELLESKHSVSIRLQHGKFRFDSLSSLEGIKCFQGFARFHRFIWLSDLGGIFHACIFKIIEGFF